FVLSMTTPPTDIYTLSLHDALPISRCCWLRHLAELAKHVYLIEVEPGLGRQPVLVPADLDAPPDQLLAGRGDRASSAVERARVRDRKSTRLNSSHVATSYAVFCLKK